MVEGATCATGFLGVVQDVAGGLAVLDMVSDAGIRRTDAATQARRDNQTAAVMKLKGEVGAIETTWDEERAKKSAPLAEELARLKSAWDYPGSRLAAEK
jgi:hypothetical protein